MRRRLIIGATAMIVTIMAMGWIYFDKKKKRMAIINTSKRLLEIETICADKRILSKK